MRSRPVNLATLAWLDRRRLWATTSRLTAFGTTLVPTLPSTLAGQSSRPSVTLRYFAPSVSWLSSTIFTLLGLLLAFILALAGLVSAIDLCFKRLSLHLDAASGLIGANGSSNVSPMPLFQNPGALGTSADFANSLFSLVGSLDLTSSFTPAFPNPPRKPGALRLEASKSPLLLRGWAVRGELGGGYPAFRAYLGEWRRLADQPYFISSPNDFQGHIKTRKPRPALSTSRAAKALGGVAAKSSPCTIGGPYGYSFYLSTPWVF